MYIFMASIYKIMQIIATEGKYKYTVYASHNWLPYAYNNMLAEYSPILSTEFSSSVAGWCGAILTVIT